MVIKWSAEVDHILLLKILEVHNIAVDSKSIADKWPADRESPTPRAISERLVKLRSLVKKETNGAGHFQVKKPSVSPPKAPRTPKTPSSVQKNRATLTGSARARKKAIKSEDVLQSTEVDDEDGVIIKTEPITNNAGPSPSSLPTPSETRSSGAQSLDGAHDTPTTPTPTRHMLTRGRRVPTYASAHVEDASDDDSDVSNFHDGRDGAGSPGSTIYGDDEMDGI